MEGPPRAGSPDRPPAHRVLAGPSDVPRSLLNETSLLSESRTADALWLQLQLLTAISHSMPAACKAPQDTMAGKNRGIPPLRVTKPPTIPDVGRSRSIPAAPVGVASIMLVGRSLRGLVGSCPRQNMRTTYMRGAGEKCRPCSQPDRHCASICAYVPVLLSLKRKPPNAPEICLGAPRETMLSLGRKYDVFFVPASFFLIGAVSHSTGGSPIAKPTAGIPSAGAVSPAARWSGKHRRDDLVLRHRSLLRSPLGDL